MNRAFIADNGHDLIKLCMKENREKSRIYLVDLGLLIKGACRRGKKEELSSKTNPDHLYAVGSLIAFNEVVSIMQQQAEIFSILSDELQLSDIEPNRDLI